MVPSDLIQLFGQNDGEWLTTPRSSWRQLAFSSFVVHATLLWSQVYLQSWRKEARSKELTSSTDTGRITRLEGNTETEISKYPCSCKMPTLLQQWQHSSALPPELQHPPSIPQAKDYLYNNLKENQYMVEYNCNPLLKLCNSTGDTSLAYRPTEHQHSGAPSHSTLSAIPSYSSSSCWGGFCGLQQFCRDLQQPQGNLLTCPKAAGSSRGKAFSELSAKEGALSESLFFFILWFPECFWESTDWTTQQKLPEVTQIFWKRINLSWQKSMLVKAFAKTGSVFDFCFLQGSRWTRNKVKQGTDRKWI